MSIIQHLQKLAFQQPDALLYEWFEKTPDGDITVKHSFSYRQVWDRVERLAHHLIHKEGLNPKDRVLLCYPPCLDFLFAFLGCILADVIPVPAYPPNPQSLKATIPAFARIKDLATARVVLSSKQYNRWTALNLFVTWPPNLKWVLTDAILSASKGPTDGYTWQHADATDTAFLQFTSGSTGDPKGVIISHRALWESCHGMAACEQSRTLPGSRQSCKEGQASTEDPCLVTKFTVVSWLPLYHDFGLIFAAILPIYRSGHALLCSPLDFIAQPLIWLRAMSKFKATASCAPNFAFDLVVRRWHSIPRQQRPDIDLSEMTFLPSGGEAVRVKTLVEFEDTFKPYGFNGKAMCPSYGFAECTVAACAEHSTELVFSKRDRNLVSCGSDFHRSGNLVAILKTDRRQENGPEIYCAEAEAAEDSEIGEIIVTGNALSSGYWSDHAALGEVSKAFIPTVRLPQSVQDLTKSHPEISSEFWFATGDLGLLEEGHLYITGRIKEIIVIRGRNYVATDIEHTVMISTPEARPGCIAAVAISESDCSTEKALILCETRDNLSDGEAKEVVQSIRTRTREAHGINASVALLKKGLLPKTSSGKLQRIKAAQMWQSGALQALAFDSASAQPSPTYSDLEEPTSQNQFPGKLQASPKPQISNLDIAETTAHSEDSGWDFAAAYEDRFSALYAQIRRIVKAHLITIESSLVTDADGDFLDPNTEWAHLGLDSLSAVLIMQELQDDANRILKEVSTPVVLSPQLLYEYPNVKTFIRHLISLHGSAGGDEGVENPTATRKAPEKKLKADEQDNVQLLFEHAFDLPRPVSSLSYMTFAAAQAFWTCFMWLAIAFVSGFALSLAGDGSWATTVILIPTVHFSILMSLALATVLLKNCLVGVYRPGCHPQYGSFHLRYWMIESTVNVVELLGMSSLHNTKAYETYIGLLGVNVSTGATINTTINTAFDLLTLGPDSMIEHKSSISCHSYQAGCLFLSSVSVGHSAIVEQRSVIQTAASVWNDADTTRVKSRGSEEQSLRAISPLPYVQPDNTTLQHGVTMPHEVQHDLFSHPNFWKLASEVPMLRWAYAIGVHWLTDTAIAVAALASFEITLWATGHLGILASILTQENLPSIRRIHAFMFVFGPQFVFTNTPLLLQGTDNIPSDILSKSSSTFGAFISTLSVRIFAQLVFTLVLTYLLWVIAMVAITLAVQHLLVPPLKNGDIVREHSYSAAIRQLYANLVRRLHSLTYFFTTGTTLTSTYYKLSGAKIGHRVLFALTEPIIEPSLLTIEDGCFVGDFSHISNFSAIASKHGGAHRATLVHMKEGSLIGMNATVQATANAGDSSDYSDERLQLSSKCIVGANSSLDQVRAQSMANIANFEGRGVSVFGQHTFTQDTNGSAALPAWSMWWSIMYHLVWPIAIMPALLSWFIVSMMPSLLLTTYLCDQLGPQVTMALTGPLYLVYAVCILSQLIIGKWVLVQHFIKTGYKIDSLYFLRRLAYAHCLDFAALFSLEVSKGTPFLPVIYNLLGSRIGSRVHLDTLAITEPDLCEIQDGCSINSSVVLFGHSLDRGRFTQAPLKVGSGSTLDNNALLLLGTKLGSFTHLKQSSATMMYSTLTGASEYAGIPAKVQQSSASLADGYRAWKEQSLTDTNDNGVEIGHSPQPAVQPFSRATTSVSSTSKFPSAEGSSRDSKSSSQSSTTRVNTSSTDDEESISDTVDPKRSNSKSQPIYKSQYRGAKPEYHDPETLEQPKKDTNIPSLLSIFSKARDKAQTPLKAIDRAFAEEVKFWQERFSAKLCEQDALTPEVKNTLLELGRETASAEDLDLLVTDVRNLPGSGGTTVLRAQDATLTDWAEHRQQLSTRAERIRNPEPYKDHSLYADTIEKTYGIVALDLLCQGELDWMVWQSFAWTILAFQDPSTIALLASSRRLFNRSVNRVTAVDALILPAMVWGRLSKRGQDGDARLNTIHGRYAHTASGVKMLWMSILDSYETYMRRMELPPWSDLEFDSFYWMLRDHCIAMNVPPSQLALHWREELHKHRSRVASMKWRKWPVATAIVGSTLEDYLGRFPADARRPLRQLLAVACPEEMLDGMGYRSVYPLGNDFQDLKAAIQILHGEEMHRKRHPHSLSSHIEIGGWKSRASQIGPSERGPSMPSILADSTTAAAMKEAGQPLSLASCPFAGGGRSSPSSKGTPTPTTDIESAVSRLKRLRPNFGYDINQLPATTVEDVRLPEDLIEVDEDEVALHCSDERGYWTIVGAYVYDVTLTVLDDVHPGGSAILRKYAGKRATAAFAVHPEDARIVACNFIVARLRGSGGNLRED